MSDSDWNDAIEALARLSHALDASSAHSHPTQRRSVMATSDGYLVRACAELFGMVPTQREGMNGYTLPNGRTFMLFSHWNPLTDDAQAMALGKAFPEAFEEAVVEWASMRRCGELNADLNRLLCERVIAATREAR